MDGHTGLRVSILLNLAPGSGAGDPSGEAVAWLEASVGTEAVV